MRKKYKMTGFARFFIFMIFFAPLAYIGASYYNGEDGIQKIINLFKGEKTNENNITAPEKQLSKDEIIEMKDKEIKELKEKIRELESQLAAFNTN